jgi:hypothetical protein
MRSAQPDAPAPRGHADSAIRVPRSVRDIPARSLAVAIADRSGDGNGSRQVGTIAMLSLPPTARRLGTHVMLAIMFDHLNTARHAGSGEPDREPSATDPERRKATSGDHRCS